MSAPEKSERLVSALSAGEEFPHLSAIAAAALRAWPDHEKFIRASLGSGDRGFMSRLERVATDVVALAGDDLDTFAQDYRWMCQVFREEQFYFRRHGKYRRATIAEAIRDIYGNAPYMARYVNGILLTQVLWQNHAQAIDIYRDKFLPGNREGYEHLEVGPGHGLFLVSAARDPRCASLTAWDVSRSSLESTRRALQKMNVVRPVAMKEAEICSVDPAPDEFDSITCSEVLEHTELPHRALDNIFRALRSGGQLFLNIPVNSPAPDHIYLWREPAEIHSMVAKLGFTVEEFMTLPPTGQTLEEALKHGFDISCVIIASKP
jgi:2-polyprenyl-3-methyl-5-hydroxy-6-metoxy-1,4-benzoquinol methylase